LISGIIAAEQNNKEWISWIAKNVKIMALRVFDIDENSSVESVISAIDYAIENWANIINLSLGQTQFKYSNEFDEIIKKAYLNNVIVVIAAWNGDTYSFKEIWVDLTQNPIAPICNNWGEWNFSIGVYASGKNWYRTNWSNYGNCAKFMAPWEDIVSTSIPIFNKSYGNYYSEESGTSFSAPIISWIIALWFNQYGEVPPDIVYNSLINSLTVNDVWNYLVDAKKYLEELENFISEEAEKNEFNELKSSYKADFKKTVGDKLLKIPKSSIKKILKQLDAMLKVQLTEDLKAKVEALKELLEDSL
jgi:subtilisin family serine protease